MQTGQLARGKRRRPQTDETEGPETGFLSQVKPTGSDPLQLPAIRKTRLEVAAEDEAASSSSFGWALSEDADRITPIAVKYLLTMMMPQLGKQNEFARPARASDPHGRHGPLGKEIARKGGGYHSAASRFPL